MMSYTEKEAAAQMRILVVDANPLFLKAAGNFLAALPGCETVLAASGEEALRLAASRPFDLVLVDYALRRAGGASLAQRLKALAPPPSIILMAPDEASLYRASCLRAGADACTAKASLGSELPGLLAGLVLRDGAPEQ